MGAPERGSRPEGRRPNAGITSSQDSARNQLEALDRFVAVRDLLDQWVGGHAIPTSQAALHLMGVLHQAARHPTAAEFAAELDRKAAQVEASETRGNLFTRLDLEDGAP